jgi:dolichol-phosphate mannosyltransferase
MAGLSLITAFYNEAESLPVFVDRAEQTLQSLGTTYEIVLVDDHSTDASTGFARQWASSRAHARYLRLARNCGSHAAYSAGLAHCTGDCAILLAADLQDPPELVSQLLHEWQEGHDVVWAARAGREGEAWHTKALAAAYYWVMRKTALPEMPARGADCLLVDRKVIDAYNAIPEKNTSFLAMILWMGFRQTTIEYVKQARHGGRSKWTVSKKIKLLVDSVLSFSYAPVRIMSALGMIMAFCGFLYALVVVVGRLTGFVTGGTGFAALMTVLLIGQGTIMTMLGVLGEYLWRTFDEARGRPRYIIEESIPGEPLASAGGRTSGL